MNLTCYIVDDENHAIEILRSFVEKTPGLELIGYSTDPLVALNEVMGPKPPDLTFLDVDMQELSGMEFAGLVNLYTKIVFTTSYAEYAIQAFEKEAEDYLLKPISYERFFKAVKKVWKNKLDREAKDKEARNFFLIKSDIKGKLIRIVKADIVTIEAMQNYVKINCTTDAHVAYLTLAEIGDYLKDDDFSRVHRSFIINNQRIRAVEMGQVTMDDQSKITIGRSYKEHFLERMQELLVQSKRIS